MNSPTFHFNEKLREVPNSIKDWSNYIEFLKTNLSNCIHVNEKVSILGELGTHLRVVEKFDESVLYLKQAIDLCSHDSYIINRFLNFVRLAHTYQWMREYKLSLQYFDLSKEIISSGEISEGLRAFYHQHLGKFFYDQSFYLSSSIEFTKALEIRNQTGANVELIQSSELSLRSSKKLVSQSLDLVIRDALVDDLSDISRIEYSWCGEDGATYDDFMSFYTNMTDREGIKVVEFNKVVIGFIGIQILSENSINIWNLGVDEAYRRYSVGSTLIAEVFNCAKLRNVKKISADVAKENFKAVECYKKIGFEVTGEVLDYYGIGQSSLRLMFTLE